MRTRRVAGTHIHSCFTALSMIPCFLNVIRKSWICFACLLAPTWAWIFINELNADNDGADFKEYIELYNNESKAISLTGYVIVLFSGGANPARAYDIINLAGHCIGKRDYFLIGTPGVEPRPNYMTKERSNILQNGGGKADAVALYFGNPGKKVN